MPTENFEEEGLAKIPDLQLAQWKFLLQKKFENNDSKLAKDLLNAVKEGSK